MIFISLGKFKEKPSNGMVQQSTKTIQEELQKTGIKILGWYWTLGRYDVAVTFEAPGEKEALKMAITVSDFVWIETLTAIPREEAIKLL
ncbi:MAG: GYD domain-containing protein [Candidatus Caldarchaeum sp.]